MLTSHGAKPTCATAPFQLTNWGQEHVHLRFFTCCHCSIICLRVHFQVTLFHLLPVFRDTNMALSAATTSTSTTLYLSMNRINYATNIQLIAYFVRINSLSQLMSVTVSSMNHESSIRMDHYTQLQQLFDGIVELQKWLQQRHRGANYSDCCLCVIFGYLPTEKWLEILETKRR